ncbi:PIN domain-containing protein [Frigoriflavimonas asaccharolytica]|uniref:Putative nucleic acid-binding protein n=1 Tax=Frigoriflavimonas asaccharolytica TaxID=2735899 RepID=A0A8J8G9N3_9FLAO|nr:PIN domain-containing protein [Frigoriflavimonas asaccharolytica]NRS93200.1 putative nucleic acid-binding protein [Frigoriflavimonas asaccharolytica]
MIVIVDTNIVFSTLLNPNSLIGELLMNVQDEITFVAPEFLIDEIEKYNEKIEKHSKLNQHSINLLKSSIWKVINFMSEENIFEENWKKAFELLKNIDPKDTPFLALALQLNSKIWTGDKKLISGL